MTRDDIYDTIKALESGLGAFDGDFDTEEVA
jgi:hypothetical protein